MLLSQLLAPYDIFLPETHDREIVHLCLSSREVKPGALFFAYPGEKADGRDYIADAIKNGAVAIIAEAINSDSCRGDRLVALVQDSVVIIYLNDVQQKIGPIAQMFYNYPAKNMQIIGVTGTSGKTSVTYILAQILNHLGISAVIMGTFGVGKPGESFLETGINTPDPISIQRYFVELKKQGVQAVAMEVSSHALIQARTQGLVFDAAVFTNLSQDHLDYHGNMEAYGLAKERFLTQHEVKNAIFNLDDRWCQQLYERYKNTSLPCFSYSQDTSQIQMENTQLIGQFNVQNILAAVTCLLSLGYDEALIVATLPKVRPVPGRLELVQKPGKPCCVIDYSHKPDALKKALIAVREFTQGKVYCVFGCGGNRDIGKRPLMAKIAEQYADEVYVTNDNPRYESAEKILQDIVQGFSSKAKVTIISDRAEAIKSIIMRAKEGDTILIAGKGHEEYQLVGDKKIYFSDRKVAEEVLDIM
ncbi:MAG: UDP-N-acetylmuramoyl-L-alanyl-D-glutamate--2,6-diaminopimelate ligase [Gammaproteobacteria bacterium]|nr:UDP-N-acetylmuramoyl-L-alanyl-D-glutamate--2,6-diaminopimelate ligase [Gammaproteobacteria bacterium]